MKNGTKGTQGTVTVLRNNGDGTYLVHVQNGTDSYTGTVTADELASAQGV